MPSIPVTIKAFVDALLHASNTDHCPLSHKTMHDDTGYGPVSSMYKRKKREQCSLVMMMPMPWVSY